MRKPLILSDTVMVLLRQYIQISDDEHAMYSDMLQDNAPLKSPVDGRNIGALRRMRTELGNEILREMWHLWTYPDVKLIRYLEWHLVLNKRLMDLCTMTFLPPAYAAGSQARVIITQTHLADTYLRALAWEYQCAQDMCRDS